MDLRRSAPARVVRGVRRRYARRRQDAALAAVYARYRDHTMINPPGYVENLRLVSQLERVAGDVVECGTWKGGMIAGIADVLGARGRQYVLFDSFEGLPPAGALDGPEAVAWQSDPDAPGYYDNCRADESAAKEAMAMSAAADVRIEKGWFEDTLPGYAAAGPSIALLRLDGDWYDSIRCCLDHLAPLVVDGGIIVLDDYEVWDGCSRAVHDYLAATGSTMRIRWSGPVVYLRVGE